MSQIAFCPECGTKLNAGDAFCGHCGQQLAAVAADEFANGATPADDGESGFPAVGIVVGLVALVIVGVNIRDWMGWGGPDEPEKPASVTFQEWANEGIPRPKMPEKGEFTNIKEQSDADSPDSFEDLLGAMVMQEIERAERAGELVDLSSPASNTGPPGATPPPGGFPTAFPAPGARIPYIEPGDQVFVSGILQNTCKTGLESITFELSVVSDGTVIGDVLSSGWLLISLKGVLTPGGDLTVSGQTPDGNVIRVNGRLQYDPQSAFLKGGGQFQLRWQDTQRSGQCSGQWLTEVL